MSLSLYSDGERRRVLDQLEHLDAIQTYLMNLKEESDIMAKLKESVYACFVKL